jgi:hypothetical protein
MTYINLFRTTEVRSTTSRGNPATFDSVAWGKINFDKNTSTLVFAALLIVCSVAVGCSSEKTKTASSTNPSAMTQPTPAVSTPATVPATPAVQAAAKPIRKKVVRKAPATVTYSDKTSGISFQYPRKYALETGDAAKELVSSDPIPMDFVQPGGVALAAVTLPESAYPNSDLGLGLLQRQREQSGHSGAVWRILRSESQPRDAGICYGAAHSAGHSAAFEADDWRHGTAVHKNPCQPRASRGSVEVLSCL